VPSKIEKVLSKNEWWQKKNETLKRPRSSTHQKIRASQNKS